MLGGGTGPPPHQSPLDLLSLLQFVLTAVLVAAGLLVLLRSAASKYFVVDGSFEPEAHGYEETPRRPMSIGLGRGKEEAAGAVGGDASSSSDAGPARCFVCGNIGTKVCRGCKSARYCSLDCQSKHWKEEHRLKCRKKDSTSGIALVPGCGTSARASCKVLERPKKILFPYDEFIKLYYSDMQVSPPCGLLNCGNSCFANVVLQCLTSTRPLVAYLLEGCHSRECRQKSRNDWCFLCELQIHIQRSKQSQQPFSPMSILSRLPSISSNLGYGRQEDAHEFMRFAIDTMQTICLDEYGGEKALDPSTQETTLIQHIFGGHLQSQVICTNCKMVSNRYENMMDLTVEIQGDAESLEKCLDQFTAKEWLDGENMYKCDGCNDYVKAWKRLTVHQAPNILTIALKRFQSGRFGKLNKRVTFPEILDLGPYMSGNGDATDVYTLYAVVVHLDMLNASFFGHYICYTKDHHGNWYRIDDCKVMQVDVEEVLSQGAYMLLYSRLKVRQPNPLEVAKQNVASSAQVADISSDKSKSVTSMEASCDIGSKLERKAMDIDEPEISILDQTCQDLWDVHGDTTKQNLLQLNELKEENASSPKEENMMKSQGPICGSQDLGHAKAKTGSSSGAGEEFDVIRVLSSDSTTEVAPASSVVSICTVGSAPQKSEENFSLSEKFVGSKPEKAGTDALAKLPNDPGTVDDSPHSSNGKTKTLALASTGSSNRRVQAKPLFSRGFLDKPLIKKKPVSQAKVSQAVEGNSVSSYKKDGKCNILPEPKSAIKSESQFRSKSFDTNIRNVCVDSESKYQGEIDVGLCYSNDGVSNGYPSYKPVQQSFYDGESCQKSVSHNMDYSMPAICHGKPIGRNQNDSGLDNMNLHEDCCLSKEKCNGFSGSHIHQGGANGFVRLPHLKPKGA